jgi:phosphonate metabolism protein (transferase hexapeptide repeat family)
MSFDMPKSNNPVTKKPVSLSNAELAEQPSIGRDCEVKNSQFGYACEVGDRCKIVNTSFGDFSYISDDSDVINTRIGKFCSIAAHTRINPGNHPLERVALHHFTYRASRYGMGSDEDNFFQWRADHSVTIGHDVWLGHGAIILPGVSIGNGAAIGAGTIITKDVEPYSIVVGNPGKPLRKRFTDEIIAGLESLCWWDWSPEILAERVDDFRQLEPQAFIKKYHS